MQSYDEDNVKLDNKVLYIIEREFDAIKQLFQTAVLFPNVELDIEPYYYANRENQVFSILSKVMDISKNPKEYGI